MSPRPNLSDALSAVIPAKAGIQFNMPCEALKNGFVSFGRMFNWIPAFAGMTNKRSWLGSWVRVPEGQKPQPSATSHV
jgi:hypothetical protein